MAIDEAGIARIDALLAALGEEAAAETLEPVLFNQHFLLLGDLTNCFKNNTFDEG